MEIKYEDISQDIFEELKSKLPIKYFFSSLWHNMKFEIFQNQNFICPKDMDYLKYIITHILC